MNLVHLDDDLIVVDKPPGLLSVPGRTEPDCAIARLQRQYPEALTVHRLDQATSGLLLFARGAAAQRALSLDFAQRRVNKRYIALVQGAVQAEGWQEIDQPLMADWPNRPRQKVDHARGKPSLTRWRVLAVEGVCTRLELEPVTGRSHQLRVHLLSLGHPIVGDTLYGGPDAERLMLHAALLHLPDRGLRLESRPDF
ncbi:MAG: RluA family pseudouridine synthase [Paucibacter sp.]|nr:RluA family pseudouridine synthase [Roseateles sp.]